MTGDKPLITIGIPIYNVERFIGQTIRSVLSQTYDNIEVIVTDDGSTDKTLNILKAIKDPRVTVISDGVNKGISYRLNQQIELAHGKYFFRMDGDDLMMPYRVEKQVEFLESHPMVDVMGTSAIIIDDENNIIGKRVTKQETRTIESIFKSGLFIHPTVAGKTSWFKKWRYREEMAGVEDVDLWIRSFSDSNIYEFEEPLMFYRDPLRFKLQTYRGRQKKLQKCFAFHRSKMLPVAYLMNCIIKPSIASALSCVLTWVGQDQKMMARRNQMLPEEELLKYKDVLEKNRA